jgi:hypothetical protein
LNPKALHRLYVVVPLLLSAVTHLMNPIGFPSIHADENTYLLHALDIQEGFGVLPRGAPHYDHPYFGWMFLSAVLQIIGYPESLGPVSEDPNSIQMLYQVPRLLMGLLAIVDSFLIYKIAERRYNRKIAFIAATLFAVMPVSWLLRRVLLDNLLLPFLLSSILFAVSLRTTDYTVPRSQTKDFWLPLISGIFLGLAIFTKIPAFTFIPVVGFLIFINSNRSLKSLLIWLIPCISIPLLWAILAISAGQFDNWMAAVIQQAAGREDKPLLDSLTVFLKVDPVLFLIGITGLGFSIIKKDFTLLLWTIPYLLFLYVVDFSDIVHMVLILPQLCIAAAMLIDGVVKYLSPKFKNKKISRTLRLAIVLPIIIFGLVNTTVLITLSVNATYFEVYAFIVKYLSMISGNARNNDLNDASIDLAQDRSEQAAEKDVVLVGRYWTKSFLWITHSVFNTDYHFVRDDSARLADLAAEHDKFQKVILVVDRRIKETVSSSSTESLNDNQSEIMKELYNMTHAIATFEDETPNFDRDTYPFTSMVINRGIGDIEIRTNSN